MANPLRICIPLFGLAWLLAAQNPEPLIKVGDDLIIRSHFMSESDLPTVTVESDGAIKVPLLGRVKVEGLTSQRVSALLEQGYAEYIVNPKLTVELVSNPIAKIGDELSIRSRFVSEQDLPNVTVQSDGMIVVPFLGRVKVEGLTLPRIAAMLEAGFAQYIADPKVTVQKAR